MLPLDLIWDAPTECPSYAEVVTELERITRVKPGREITPVRAQAKIERTPDGRYHLRLLTEREGQTGETALDATSCPVLKRGVTLVLALTLGDGVDVVDEPAAAEPPPKQPESPPVAKKPAPPPASPPARAAPAEQNARLRFSPWLAASGAWGLVKKPSFGPQLGLAVGKARWQARADVTFWPPVDGARYQNIDSSYLAFIGAVGACARALPSGWSLAACGTFQVGAIHGTSNGAFRDGSATAPWYAVAPSVVVTAPAPTEKAPAAVAVRLEASLAIAFEPPRFAIQYADDVYTVSRFIPAVSIGLSW